MEAERDRFSFARLEMDAPEAANFEDRPGDRRLLVAEIELHDLLAGAFAHVDYVDLNS